MQTKIIAIVEAPNDDKVRAVTFCVSRGGVQYNATEGVEVLEFHIGMFPAAVNPAKVTRHISSEPGNDTENSIDLKQ